MKHFSFSITTIISLVLLSIQQQYRNACAFTTRFRPSSLLSSSQPPSSSLLTRTNVHSISSSLAFHKSRHTTFPLFSSTKNDETTTSTSTSSEPELSEVDARVLQSILQDEKLDLKTEENMKKLLERGISSRNGENVAKQVKKEEEEDEENGKFSSTVFKKMSNENFWNSLRAKTSSLFESTKIFLQNRVERDATLLASLGLFAWERAKRDVARGLPSAGKTGARVAKKMQRAAFLINSNSSFVENVGRVLTDEGDDDDEEEDDIKDITKKEGDLFEELNTPMDEIKKVTEELRSILSGESSPTSSSSSPTTRRGLKSLAPAGASKNAERQRRAYNRKKATLLKKEKEGIDATIGRLVGGVTDAAWEIQREMKVEGNKPGYRSEGVRNAIEGSASNALLQAGEVATKLLGGGGNQDLKRLGEGIEEEEENVVDVVMDGLLLGGEKWKTEPIPQPTDTATATTASAPVQPQPAIATPASPPPPPVTPQFILTNEDLLEEKARFAATLRFCLERPDQSWMSPSVITSSDFILKQDEENDSKLREVVMAMICARDAMDVNEEEEVGEMVEMQDVMDELKEMRGLVEDIVTMAENAAGVNAANALRLELLGQPGGEGEEEMEEVSLLSKLDFIETAWEEMKNAPPPSQQPPAFMDEESAEVEDDYFFGNAEEVRVVSSTVVDAPKTATASTTVDTSNVWNAEVVVDDFPNEEEFLENEVFAASDTSSSSSLQDFLENQSKQRVVKDPNPPMTMYYAQMDNDDDDDDVVDANPVIVDADPVIVKPAPYVDVVIDNDDLFTDVTTTTSFTSQSSTEFTTNEKEEEIRSVVADIVTDDELESVSNNVKEAKTLSEEEMMKEAVAAEEERRKEKTEEEENILILAALRTIDVLFFITEKVVTLGVPGLIAAARNFQVRVQNVQQDGLGSEGWELLTNVESGAKRY